ncbi:MULTISPECIES: hypothetical protein [unclassified Acinetobacter]|uniref:hypothetical protein n=2 Tax=Moraxellaceae TaxID=468 RepID=UPI002575DC48|nr:MULTISPECIES: hypothetical protein [unclassified Acinetobacter]MDM1756158.1 hypothetical protein [Acinetobacter sp. 256-1]MDM1759298.1 hypothetical protein [Acinetobacter sp. 251-1]
MHITGYDYIFYSPVSYKKFFKRFRKKIKQHLWSTNLESFDYDKKEDNIIAYFQKDSLMDQFSDEHGYALNTEGEGPFAIFTSKHRTHEVQSFVRDLKSTVDGEEFNDESRITTVYICSKIYRYTLVLPADIDTDPFSKLIHACAFTSLKKNK